MLEKKLQIKAGQSVAVVDSPVNLDLDAPQASEARADALLFFVRNQAELEKKTAALLKAAQRDALVWLVYPKARLLGTDLNRDIIREYALKHELDTVRQIAIDGVWSALRLKQA